METVSLSQTLVMSALRFSTSLGPPSQGPQGGGRSRLNNNATVPHTVDLEIRIDFTETLVVLRHYHHAEEITLWVCSAADNL